MSFTIDEPLNGERLHAYLESLPGELLRGKGVLFVDDDPKTRTIYQRVGSRWSCTPAEPWGEETPHSTLVFIGPTGSIDESHIETKLLACIADETTIEEANEKQPHHSN